MIMEWQERLPERCKQWSIAENAVGQAPAMSSASQANRSISNWHHCLLHEDCTAKANYKKMKKKGFCGKKGIGALWYCKKYLLKSATAATVSCARCPHLRQASIQSTHLNPGRVRLWGKLTTLTTLIASESTWSLEYGRALLQQLQIEFEHSAHKQSTINQDTASKAPICCLLSFQLQRWPN